MAYSDLLKDPRWQKKRLEILSSDLWRCRECESKDKTLNVHHLYYIKGNAPWDYPNNALITLCENCHQEAHKINWQQAFLDLNVTPKRLLDMALCFHFQMVKYDFLTQEINTKYKCRPNHDHGINTELDVTATESELNELYDFFQSERKKYING